LVIQAIRSWIAKDPAAQTGSRTGVDGRVAGQRSGDVALTRLKEEDTAVSDMASRLGYDSEAAFSRAFKRFLGFPPGAVRRAKSDPTYADAGGTSHR
jgi:hypothetical protein